MTIVSPSPGPARRASPQPLALAIAVNALGVPWREVADSRRRSTRARQVAMYLAHVALGETYSRIGRAFGRDPSTARHACARVEDRREEAGLDRLLGHLEWASALFQTSLSTAAPGGR